jgi:peptide deformylase
MSVRETIQAGNSIVHTKSKEVRDFESAEVKKVVEDLIDTMRHTDLVGMAAPQIGSNKRIFVTEIRSTKFREGEGDKLRVFVNPKIVESSDDEIEGYEGCGSVASAQFFGPVVRPAEIVVSAYDGEGKPFELSASGLLARVIQHEIDHLEGELFHEKICDLKRVMSKEEYLKSKVS